MNNTFKKHKFDEIIRFFNVLILVIFGIVLIFLKSDLSRDVVLLLIGMIGGKYIKG